MVLGKKIQVLGEDSVALIVARLIARQILTLRVRDKVD